MKKMVALSASLVLLGSVAAQAADARKPVQLTAKEMDRVTAGMDTTTTPTIWNSFNTLNLSQTQQAGAGSVQFGVCIRAGCRLQGS